MRKQFIDTLTALYNTDKKLFLFLGDIGVHGFRELLKSHPDRAFNFGILEQAMVGAGAGVASEGFIPVLHTIAPFMIERAYEQIKIDFGYQKLTGNFVSVGASFDYAGLGCTHHCPADVSLMFNIPLAKIFLPGNTEEFDKSFRDNYKNGLNYFRLSEEKHKFFKLESGLSLLRKGELDNKAVIFVGPTLRFFDDNSVPKAYSVYYLNMISSSLDLCSLSTSEKCLVIQDFYNGPVENLVQKFNPNLLVKTLAPQRKFLESYGTREEAYNRIGLNQMHINKFINNDSTL